MLMVTQLTHPHLYCLQGVPARQYDAWDLGMVTTDDFTVST
jgi:hypothetical protein